MFGSVATGKVHKDSDIDILIIGKLENSISCYMTISEALIDMEFEVNVMYYNVDKFQSVKASGNLFLNGVMEYAIKEEDLHELL